MAVVRRRLAAISLGFLLAETAHEQEGFGQDQPVVLAESIAHSWAIDHFLLGGLLPEGLMSPADRKAAEEEASWILRRWETEEALHQRRIVWDDVDPPWFDPDNIWDEHGPVELDFLDQIEFWSWKDQIKFMEGLQEEAEVLLQMA